MDNQRKYRLFLVTFYTAIGAVIMLPVVLSKHDAQIALLAVGGACFVAVYSIKGVGWLRDRKTSETVREPRSNVQVLPAQSSGPDGESR